MRARSQHTVGPAILAVVLAAVASCAPDADVPHPPGDGAYATPEDTRPLAPGAHVPSVQVRSVQGDAVDLAAAVRDHGALLVFYRGGW